MKKALVVLGLAAVTFIGVDMLSDATQTRPDPKRPNSRTELIFRVQTLGQRPEFAAEGLWGACQGTALRKVLPPGMMALGDGRFRIVVQPALGRHARDRMTGCLEDMTLDRIKGKVVSMRELSNSER